MENIINEITKLTEVWYKLIGKDHHKDRDCHWYVEAKWSYGNPPVYSVIHHGYVADRIEEVYDTYEAALHGLKETIEYWIQTEKDSAYFNSLNGAD